MNKPELNLAFKGGAASAIDGFSPMSYELEKVIDKLKEKYDITLSGASAGGLTSAMIACGLFGDTARDLFLSLKCDKAMKMSGDVEQGTWLQRITELIPMLISLETSVSKDFKNVLANNLSWNIVKEKGIAKNVFIAITDWSEVSKLAGRKYMKKSYIAIYKILKGKGNFAEQAQKVNVYYGAIDGWYMFNMKSGFYKISDEVTPLADLVFGTFANPLLRDLTFKINNKWGSSFKIEAFDGGLLQNESNLPFIGKDFLQFSCKPEATEARCLSDYFYLLNKAKAGNFYELQPIIPDLNFFAFDDKNVKTFFNSQRTPTNIFSKLV